MPVPAQLMQQIRRTHQACLKLHAAGPDLIRQSIRQRLWILRQVEVQRQHFLGLGVQAAAEPEKVWEKLHAKYPGLSLLVTLGSRGSVAFRHAGGTAEIWREEAVRVKAVDTTAAGDTYTGYFIAALTEGKPLQACMREAARAAAIAVTRPGAAGSVPWREELR